MTVLDLVDRRPITEAQLKTELREDPSIDLIRTTYDAYDLVYSGYTYTTTRITDAGKVFVAYMASASRGRLIPFEFVEGPPRPWDWYNPFWREPGEIIPEEPTKPWWRFFG